MPLFGRMVFILRLRPTQGYDYKKIRSVVTELGLCSHDPDFQPQSVSISSDEATLQFTRSQVGIILRTGDPTWPIRFAYLFAWAASGVPPGFEVVRYDFRGTPARPTVNAIFNAFVDGDVLEAARLWGQERGRMLLAELAVRDLEEAIRGKGPEAALGTG